MRRGTRRLYSLLALVALAHASGQWVRAVPCAPSPDAAAAAAAERHDASADHAAGGAHAGAAHRQADTESSRCPLGPMGIASGCAGAASIPSFVTFGLALSAPTADPLPCPDLAPQVLFGADIFRPPRA